MSEQSSHESDRTAVHDPQPAGFPAEKTAVDTGPTPTKGRPPRLTSAYLPATTPITIRPKTSGRPHG
jgi:hypothetical protein